MDPLTMMFISTIFGSLLPVIAADNRQGKEFNQQKELLGSEQDFAREREDIAWQRSRPQQIYSDYLASGFNPNMAAQAVLGGASESATAGGSPSAPTVNSAIDAVTRSLGQGNQQLFDSFMKQAQIKNLEANTNKTDIEAGILPRDYMLRSLSVTKQLDVWDKSLEKMSSEIGLTNEQKELVRQQHLYYGRMSESQIQVNQSTIFKNIADARLAYQKISESVKNMQVMDADIALKDAQKSNVVQDTANKIIEGDYTYQKSERERIAKEFEEKMSGIPLTADAQKYVHSLILDGKFDEVQKFYDGLFQTALNQSVGSSLGAAIGTPAKTHIGLPFNLYGFDRYNFNRWSNDMYQLPYWNYQ